MAMAANMSSITVVFINTVGSISVPPHYSHISFGHLLALHKNNLLILKRISMELHQKLDGILLKATKLADENKRLKTGQVKLLAEIEALKHSLQEEVRKTEDLNNKIKIIKLAHNLGQNAAPGLEVTELKRKLNEYIKEVDNCIAMLNA